MVSRTKRRKRRNQLDIFVSRLKGESSKYMMQGESIIEEENVKITWRKENCEDNFYRSVPTIFDDVTGFYDLMEHESNECKVPLRESHESKEESKCHFSSLHIKLLYFCLNLRENKI